MRTRTGTKGFHVPAELANALGRARRVVVFTGAGVSAESGIPTFRDAMTGLWANFRPEELASPEGFAADPARVWQWYDWRRKKVAQAKPNAGHLAIASWALRLERLDVVTQNVDGLHERAGSRNVVELHGNIGRVRCARCATPAMEGETWYDTHPHAPPACPSCGSSLRPDVVWFGEMLPAAALERAEEAARSCEMLFSVGTSSLVYPAAEIPYLAAASGATVVQVNPQATPLDPVADFNLRGSAATILPALARAAWPASSLGEDQDKGEANR
jgi:NAD-dependent deacetylase